MVSTYNPRSILREQQTVARGAEVLRQISMVMPNFRVGHSGPGVPGAGAHWLAVISD